MIVMFFYSVLLFVHFKQNVATYNAKTMRKTIRSLPIIALAMGFYFLLACNKKQVTIEEPKVENCVEAVYLGLGCGSAFFMLKDTSQVKGTFKDTSWYSGTVFGFSDMIEKKLSPPYRVFVGLFWDSKIKNIKLKVDKTYYFEYRKAQAGEKNTTYVDNGRCFPSSVFYDQIVLLDTLTSKCTRIP